MSNNGGNDKLLEEFENHWIKICRDIETTEMPLDDVRDWNLKFESSELDLRENLPGHYYNREDKTRIYRIKDKFDIAILKSKANYREKEKIRLKDSYGFLAPLIYTIFKILGKV